VVAEADEGLGVATERLEVDPGQEADRAVAAADGPECGDGIVAESGPQVGGALLVGPGEVAVLLPSRGRDDGFEAEGAAPLFSVPDALLRGGTGRRDEEHPVARTQTAGPTHDGWRLHRASSRSPSLRGFR